MLSMCNISTGQASTYYTKEDYYTKEAGTWSGKGAEMLGLSGKINNEQYQNLIRGLSPDGSKTLVEGSHGNEDKHRAGMDLTFSAPKSASILSEICGDTRIVEAHNAAVTKALEYAEANYSQARITEDGQTMRTNTNNLIVAKFQHNTSRELDPQMHTHCVVMNMTQRAEDGAWRALSNEELFQNKMLIGQIYRSEMAASLKDMGYSIQSDNKGLYEIAGVDQKLIDTFSTRAEQIANEVKELKESGNFSNMSEAELKQVACLNTRIAKKDIDKEVIQKAWDDKLQEQGVSKESILESVKTASEKDLESKNTEIKMNEYDYINSAVIDKTENESTFSREDILKNALKKSLGEFKVGQLSKAFNELNSDNKILSLDNNVFTSKEMWRTERETIKDVKAGIGKDTPILSSERAAESIKNWEATQQAKDPNLALTAGQREAAEHILTSNDKICGIQGDAGTGKTTMLKAVKEIAAAEGKTLRGMSIQGKAAQEIEAAAGIKSSTIDSFLHQFKKSEIVTPEQFQQKSAEYNKYASMLSKEDWKDLQTKTPGQVLKENTGLKSAVLDSKTAVGSIDRSSGIRAINQDGNTPMSIKTETGFVGAAGDRLTDAYKNATHKLITSIPTVDKHAVSFEKNRTYDVVFQGKDGKLTTAKQMTHFQTNKDGFKQSMSITTFHKNGDISVFSRETTGSVTIERSQLIQKPENLTVKGKEVWVMDEASMTGSKKMHEVMQAAKSADAKLVVIGDTKQFQSISAGKSFEEMQEKGGMKTVSMGESIRQKDKEYHSIVSDIANKKIDRAFDKLNSQGKITEITDRKDRLNAVVKDYTSRTDYKDTLIVTARNADRQELNSSIRNELKEQGKLKGQEHTFNVRVSKNLSEENKHFAQSYSKNDILINNKAGNGMKAGAELFVKSIDQQNHTLTAVDKKGQEHNINLMKDGQNYAVYSQKQQSFCQGDKVMLGKNDKSLKVQNGQTGTIKTLDDKGNAVIQQGDKEQKLNLNSQYNYIDHAYAVTAYKSQGQTSTNVIYHADTSKESSYNEGYVALSRGKDDVKIYTDNKANLQEQMKTEQMKTSTLDPVKTIDIKHSSLKEKETAIKSYEKISLNSSITEKAAENKKYEELKDAAIMQKAKVKTSTISIKNSTQEQKENALKGYKAKIDRNETSFLARDKDNRKSAKIYDALDRQKKDINHGYDDMIKKWDDFGRKEIKNSTVQEKEIALRGYEAKKEKGMNPLNITATGAVGGESERRRAEKVNDALVTQRDVESRNPIKAQKNEIKNEDKMIKAWEDFGKSSKTETKTEAKTEKSEVSKSESSKSESSKSSGKEKGGKEM